MGIIKKIEIGVNRSDFSIKTRRLAASLRKNKVIAADIHFDTNNPPKFFKIRPLLYFLINTFENRTSIIYLDLPFCVLPDAEEHIINEKSEEKIKHASCDSCKFDNFCGGFPKNSKEEEAAPVKDLPKEVSMEITTKCNLECSFCFNRNTHDDFFSLNPERTTSVIEQAKKLGISKVRFTGGEPLLDGKISEYVTHAKKLGMDVWLNTNGFATENYSDILLKSTDSILIPLHGITNEPEITGKPDSGSRKIETIRRIKQAGKNIPIRIGTVVMDKNLKELEKVHSITEKLKINWELYRLIGDNENTNRPDDISSLYKILLKIYSKNGKRIILTNAFPFCFFDDIDTARLFSNGGFLDDGRDRIVIKAGGEAKPTYYSKDVIGSWKNINLAWKNKTMKNLRNLVYLPKKCYTCRYRTLCKGGSRTMARNSTGSYYSNDPLVNE